MMNEIERVIVIVLDSVGIGDAPDASMYGDEGSDTLGHIATYSEKFCLPTMNLLGLHKLNQSYKNHCNQLPDDRDLRGSFGRLTEQSKGKDTTTGHWELTGVVLDAPFPVYPNGFPPRIIDAFSKETHRGVLGNIAASGTEIIQDLGAIHMETGKLIVYTSADSVFQIAAHEEIVPLDSLYEYCLIARKILTDEHSVSRVIARPFRGSPGSFYRTENRRDFSLKPIRKTVLDLAEEAGMNVVGIGKISDIFAGRGITTSLKTKGNLDGIRTTIDSILKRQEGIIFTNLVDFDMLYGHRNNTQGYADALLEFDGYLQGIMTAMKSGDLLMITADHGCDPTNESTDHTRERVPLLLYGNKIRQGVNLGTRDTFADVVATIAEIFSLDYTGPGKSFLSQIKN